MDNWKVLSGANADYFRNTCPVIASKNNPDLGSKSRSLRVRWYPADSEENYVAEGNAYTIEDVDYDINSHGFRCEEFSNINESGNKKLIVFGCSNTLGIGMPETETWASMLQSKISNRINEKIDLINLGIPGGSADDVIRLVSMIENKFDVDYVCMYTPPRFRKTLIDSDRRIFNYLVGNEYNPKNHSPSWRNANELCSKILALVPENFEYNEFIAEQLVKTYALLSNASYKIITTHSYLEELWEKHKTNTLLWESKARDLAHYGKPMQEHISNDFYKGLFNE